MTVEEIVEENRKLKLEMEFCQSKIKSLLLERSQARGALKLIEQLAIKGHTNI